ncbi:MAG: hypothetical protein RL138_421 [Bacteroidota bacterium]|jgi:cell division protein FtsW
MKVQDPMKNVDPRTLVRKTKGDRSLWLIVIFLYMISMLAVYSSTSALAVRKHSSTEAFLFGQIGFGVVGLFFMWVAHSMNYKFYSRVSQLVFFLAIPLLFYTLVFGSHVNDASRWIKIPYTPLSFQPSDIAKFALLLYLARLLAKRQDVITDLRKGFFPVIIPVLLTFFLILPANFSTAAILLATCMIVIFFGRASLKHIAGLVGVMVITVVFLIGIAKLVGYDGRISTWTSRLSNFGSAEKKEVSFQTQQANIAIANGSWTGLGPGNSKQCNYLPHAYSDFIFATIVEEYGMLGAATVIFLYLVFLFRCIKIFRKCNGAFGGFLVLGLGFSLTIQAFMHMAVNVHLFPVTGITLPFISKGGTSFIMTCISAGIILSVSRYIENPEDLNPDTIAAATENSTPVNTPAAASASLENLPPTPIADAPTKSGDPF